VCKRLYDGNQQAVFGLRGAVTQTANTDRSKAPAPAQVQLLSPSSSTTTTSSSSSSSTSASSSTSTSARRLPHCHMPQKMLEVPRLDDQHGAVERPGCVLGGGGWGGRGGLWVVGELLLWGGAASAGCLASDDCVSTTATYKPWTS